MAFDGTNGILQRLRTPWTPPAPPTPPPTPTAPWVTDLQHNRFGTPLPTLTAAQATVAFSTVSAGTIAAAAATAPDGTSTASNVVEDATTGVREFSHSGPRVELNITYAFSVYAKAGLRRYLQMKFGTSGFGSTHTAMFDLQLGVVVSSLAGLVSATISDVQPNGYYRCCIVAKATATSASAAYFMRSSTDGVATSYAGSNGATALSFWIPSAKVRPDLIPLANVSITNLSQLTTARATLINEVFAGPMPSEIGTLTAIASPIAGLTGVASCQKMTTVAYAALEAAWSPTLPYVLWSPTTPNGKAIILHQGHSTNPSGLNLLRFSEVLQQLITAGWNVMGMLMPIGSTHSGAAAPFHNFVGPQVIAVNTLFNAGLSIVHMIGISGGGWETTICPAVDIRIQKSYPTAGTLPFYLDTISGRDYEQNLPGISESYLDLYLLAACGNVFRRHKQILYTDDPTVAGTWQYNGATPTYGAAIAALAATLGGSYEFVLYPKAQHEFDPAVVQTQILPEIT